MSKILLSSGTAVLDGNELIVKGALEAGVALITGYPGSPVASVFDIIEANQEMFRDQGIRAVIANNENQSAAILHGAMSIPGVRAMTVMKSVGVYVALDGLAIVNYTAPERDGATLCVAGDDPALSSTQVGADSRLTFSSAKIPVIEPSSNQEIKDWIAAAFELSRASQMLVGCIVTTNQADGGGTVVVRENIAPAINLHARVAIDTAAIELHRRVAVPPNSAWMERDLLQRRMPLFMEALRASRLDRIEAGEARTGFVTSGNAYNYLRHALHELGSDHHFPLLKLACTWPVDERILLEFSRRVDRLIVIEEKRGFVEAQIKEILHDARQSGGRTPEVWGKRFPSTLNGIPEEGGLTPSILIDRLGRLLLHPGHDADGR